MAHLVGDDVRLGEVALRGELRFELPEKCEIDVHAMVGGAVEGPAAEVAEPQPVLMALSNTATCGAGY